MDSGEPEAARGGTGAEQTGAASTEGIQRLANTLFKQQNMFEFFLDEASDVFVVYKCCKGKEPRYDCTYPCSSLSARGRPIHTHTHTHTRERERERGGGGGRWDFGGVHVMRKGRVGRGGHVRACMRTRTRRALFFGGRCGTSEAYMGWFSHICTWVPPPRFCARSSDNARPHSNRHGPNASHARRRHRVHQTSTSPAPVLWARP